MRALAAAFLLACLPLGAAQAAAPLQGGQAPGYYRMMLGKVEITALLDSSRPFPADKLAIGAEPGEVDKLLAKQYLTSPFENSINAFLINTGERLMLIDTGLGPGKGDCCGKLLQQLSASGYKPSEIDDIFITHSHGDHVGGLTQDGKAVFANATLHIAQAEANFWLKTGDPAKDEAAEKIITPYSESGHLKTFSGAEELVPGLSSLPCPGHTPGHTCYELTSGADHMLFWGDIVHLMPIQMEDPGIAVTYDADPKMAVTTRKKIFTKVAEAGWWVAGAHIAFPGIGHLRSLGEGHYIWIPANYTINQ
ncbi:MBL fold metallo-hydrolase [Thioclava sp. BHET1]|nr:MBL fold metallo-hydrolase [Thioclava sp. BHET1]